MDLVNVHNTAISDALSPSRLCGSLKAGVLLPRWIAPIKHHPEIRANQGRTREEPRHHRCTVPRDARPYAIIFSPPCSGLATGYSSEALVITVRYRNRGRGMVGIG